MFINKEKFIENLLNKCKECFEDCSTEIDITSLQNKIEILKKEKKKYIPPLEHPWKKKSFEKYLEKQQKAKGKGECIE